MKSQSQNIIVTGPITPTNDGLVYAGILGDNVSVTIHDGTHKVIAVIPVREAAILTTNLTGIVQRMTADHDRRIRSLTREVERLRDRVNELGNDNVEAER